MTSPATLSAHAAKVRFGDFTHAAHMHKLHEALTGAYKNYQVACLTLFRRKYTLLALAGHSIEGEIRLNTAKSNTTNFVHASAHSNSE